MRLAMFLSAMLISSMALAQQMSWQKREQWIIGDQREIEALQNDIANTIGVGVAVVVFFEAAGELGLLAECFHYTHMAADEFDLYKKINELKAVQADRTRQWNLLTQQLATSNPKEWHRFQMADINDFETRQSQLRQQGRQPAPTCKPATPKKNPPPSSTYNNTVPPNCQAILQQEATISNEMIYTPTWDVQQALKAQLNAIEPQAMACRRAMNGLPPINSDGSVGSGPTISNRPQTPPRGVVCGVTVRC